MYRRSKRAAAAAKGARCEKFVLFFYYFLRRRLHSSFFVFSFSKSEAPLRLFLSSVPLLSRASSCGLASVRAARPRIPKNQKTTPTMKLALVAVAAIVALSALSLPASASIHSYNNDYFYSVGDAYIFRGGREGLYASTKEVRWSVGGTKRERERERGREGREGQGNEDARRRRRRRLRGGIEKKSPIFSLAENLLHRAFSIRFSDW